MTEEECERFLQRVAQKMTEDAMELLSGGGAFQKPQPTALRLTPSGRFEVVELRDDGSIIEPPQRCPQVRPCPAVPRLHVPRYVTLISE